jgi:HlyD family secretion protein
MRLLKNPRLLAAIAVVALILAMAFWPGTAEIDGASVVRGPMQVTIDEEGETRVRDRFVVSAPVAGRVERIELEPGDPVVRGKTVVARLRPAAAPLIDLRDQAGLRAAVEAARASIGQAQAERDRSKAALQRTQSTRRRLETLEQAGAISGDELEAAQTAMKSAEESLRSAEFAVARAASSTSARRSMASC